MSTIAELGLSLLDDLARRAKLEQEPHYNIFRVLGVDRREVLMCRVLADLLDPAGFHGRGDRCLRSFLCDVLRRQPSIDFSSVSVLTEYLLPGGRRIDIVIQGTGFFIPIEVKIDAGDQNSQCYDYARYAQTMEPAARVVYLTKWGDMPDSISLSSADGTDSLSKEEICCISFADDMIPWLEGLLEEDDGPEPVNAVIRQYCDAIREFTSSTSEAFKMCIADEAVKNEGNFRAALAVAESINVVKARLICLVFQEFEEQMELVLEELALQREHRFAWYEYRDEATEAYYRRGTWPGLNYVFRDVKLSGGVELWFRIEIAPDSALYAGLCLFSSTAESGEGGQIDDIPPELEREVLAHLNVDIDKDGWWLTWWYLPTGGREVVLQDKVHADFRGNMSDAARRLSDESYRRSFVKTCVELIRNRLHGMKKDPPPT